MPRDEASRPPRRSGPPDKRSAPPRSSAGGRAGGARSGGSSQPRRSSAGEATGGGYKGRPENARNPRGANRGERPERREGNTPGRPPVALDVPDLPDEVTFDQLDKAARARLRTLSKDNAEDVGRHLVMAGKMMDIDPERAYRHAQVAVARGGRVDVVREAAALTAYATGRYAEALKEFRTVRRLSGVCDHLPLMADCERGLGRPERAIALSHDPDAERLDHTGAIELRIVVAGARMDMKDPEAAHMVLSRLDTTDLDLRARIDTARVEALRALDRGQEADDLEATMPAVDSTQDDETWADEVVLYDIQESAEPDPDHEKGERP